MKSIKNKIIDDFNYKNKRVKMYKEHKIFMVCKKNNIADINEFKSFYYQYKNYYNVIDLVKAYKKHIFIYGEFKY